jgi:hypothetical protein
MKRHFPAIAFALLLEMSFASAQIPGFDGSQSAEKTKPPFDSTMVYPVPDTIAPMVSCIPTVTVNIAANGLAQLWSTDFILAAVDNLTPQGLLRFGIRESGTGQGFPFDSSGNVISSVLYQSPQIGVHQIESWVQDWVGNSSVCTTTVTLTDPNGHSNLDYKHIKVHLKTPPNCTVAEGNLIVKGVDAMGFAFYFVVNSDEQVVIVPSGSSGTITPFKDDNPLNGLGTWDRELMIRHYNGTELLGNPYLIIAADVNRDGVVSEQDQIELTRLILGIDEKFQHNTSWRFILESYTFQNPDSPLGEAFPESFSFSNIQQDYEINFIPIKVGDLNGSAVCNNIAGESEESRLGDLPPVSLDTGDVEPPVIVCLNGIQINIMPTKMITVWASDFIAWASDNITPFLQLKFGIREAGTGTGFPVDANGNPMSSITFDCTHLGLNTIEVWAIDEQGNADYCTAPLEILDNNNNCINNGVDGSLCFKEYCSGNGLVDVGLRIYSDTLLTNPPISIFQAGSDNSCIDLPQFAPIDSTNLVSFSKEDNPLNGVTGFDIQRLSRHLRGIEPFTEPWQWVAADANLDNMVNAQDSVTLVHLILGFIQSLPQEASWRFFRSNHVFPSPNPLSQPLPETIRVGELVDSLQFTFYGIKIGDLSVNCQPQTPVNTLPNAVIFFAAVSPNPTDGSATLGIFTEQSGPAQVQIRDMSGKLTYEISVQLNTGQQSLEIPESALAYPGMYFWNLQVGKQQQSGKLIRH